MIKKLAETWSQHGAFNTLRWLADYAKELIYERRFAVGTAGSISKERLGISDADSNEYVPTGYSHFFRAMRHVPIGGTFVDYGCGSGRIVLSAATLPFERVIGIELSPELISSAKTNLTRTSATLKCSRVEFLEANASTWKPPGEITVFYFFNPFMGETLQSVIQNIADSLRRAPREAWIVFGCPYHADAAIAQAIPRSWTREVKDILWPPFTEAKSMRNAHRHRIYRLDSRANSS